MTPALVICLGLVLHGGRQQGKGSPDSGKVTQAEKEAVLELTQALQKDTRIVDKAVERVKAAKASKAASIEARQADLAERAVKVWKTKVK